ncbi:Glutamate racemase [Candidatus Hartigia pinicola]|nr:Glutamate racemase [Candidatus Hartigia pinicola]
MDIIPLEESIIFQESINFHNNLSNHPTILILDSGVGGLSIYRECKKIALNAQYIYTFDNEAFPYGEKSEEFITKRVYKIVDAIKKRHSLTIAVIACNTASAGSLSILRSHFNFPIVGIVPVIQSAIKLTKNGVVGLLATKATVNRKYTNELIKRFSMNCKILSLGSSDLVQLAERKLYGETISLREIAQAVKSWLKMLEPPDTIILGCTHFPLLIEELKTVLPHNTKFVDSGMKTAKKVINLIDNQKDIILTNKKNFAYCLTMKQNMQNLHPALSAEGFSSLKKLTI